jgi:uncharacterized membrane protein YqjE
MEEDNHQPPGITTLVGRLARTGVGAIQNRFELLAIEWQEERLRLTQLLVWIVGSLFLAATGFMLVTAAVLLLIPQEYRAYVAGGLGILYLAGAVTAWMVVRNLLKKEPFAETLEQARKDKAWLKSLE